MSEIILWPEPPSRPGLGPVMLVLAVQAGLLAMHGLSSTTMPANAPMSVMVTMPAGQSSHSTQRAANADT